MEQVIGSRLRKEYDRVSYCHHVCLIYTLSTSREMLGWMSYKLEARQAGETTASHMHDRSFVSLGRFIPTYFILFIAMVNGIVSLISLSVFSLLVAWRILSITLLACEMSAIVP